jgi:hypothetical protein
MAVASVSVGGDFRVGDVMSRAWRLFTGNLLFFLAVPFVIYVITFVSALVFGFLFVFAGIGTGSVALVVVGVALAVILVLSLNLIGQGVLLLGAFQRLRGQTIRVGVAVQRVLHRFVPLVGLGILWFLAVAVTTGVSFAILSGLAAVIGGWAFALTPVFFVPPTILFIMWAVIVPACIVEEFGPVGSMSRSAELTKGFRWKIFGIVLLLGFVLVVASALQLALTFASQALGTVFSVVWSVLWIAYLSCTIIMIYHDLRVAKEGVDTEQIASVFD